MFFIILLLILIPSKNQSQNQSAQKPQFTVLVMPFERMINYPYKSDLIRESLITGFYQKGFIPIEDDSLWSLILDKDYEFTNLSQEQADSLAQITGVDLVAYGNLNDFSTVRLGTISTNTYKIRPAMFKIYDYKKKSVVLYERLELYSQWGLFTTKLSVFDIGEKIASMLKNRGY